MKRKTYAVQLATSTGAVLSAKRHSYNAALRAAVDLLKEFARSAGLQGEWERVDHGKETDGTTTVHGWIAWHKRSAPQHSCRAVINLIQGPYA